jgi:ribonuclease HI
VLIYVDGARALGGKVGAAVFISSMSLKLSMRLSDNLSIDSAELEAIYQAIAIIAKHNILKPVIITDSLNAITSLS